MIKTLKILQRNISTFSPQLKANLNIIIRKIQTNISNTQKEIEIEDKKKNKSDKKSLFP